MIASSIIVFPLGMNSIAHTLGLIVFRLTADHFSNFLLYLKPDLYKICEITQC